MAITNWHLLNNPVEFVTSQGKDDTTKGNRINSTNNATITGNQAKNIYETILNEPSVSQQTQNSVAKSDKNNFSKTRKRKSTSPPKDTKTDVKTNIKIAKPNVSPALLFKSAETGNLPTVEACINGGVNVNVKDLFSWTALMMASMNGNIEIVKFLLLQGAEWENEYDGSGYDAYDLACMSGCYDIANLLIHKKSFVKSHAFESAKDLAEQFMKKEKVWCDVCHCDYTIDAGHMTSVLHRFSHRQQNGEFPSTSYFYLNPSNRGYKMLRKDGWDGVSGLGPNMDGNKYPIKTKLRTNRECLGSTTSGPSRVTHFASFDKNAVKNVEKINKKKRKKKEKRLKKMEIDFRRQFH